MIRRCARSIGSTSSPVLSRTRVASSGSRRRQYACAPPLPPLAASRWHGRSARNAHSLGSSSGRSTSTHSVCVWLTACLSGRGWERTAGAKNTSSPRFACRSASASSPASHPSLPLEPPGRKWSGRVRGGRGRVTILSLPSSRRPAASSTRPLLSVCSIPSWSARCRAAGRLAENIRPSSSLTRQGSAGFADVSVAGFRVRCLAGCWERSLTSVLTGLSRVRGAAPAARSRCS